MAKETDFDRKLKRLSRKTELEILKKNMGFELELKELDDEINHVMKDKIDEFDVEKDSLSKYLKIGHKDAFVERMRSKLDNL